MKAQGGGHEKRHLNSSGRSGQAPQRQEDGIEDVISRELSQSTTENLWIAKLSKVTGGGDWQQALTVTDSSLSFSFLS